MSSRLQNIGSRLPSLYKPEAGDTSLLGRYLQATSTLLEELNKDACQVLQSHWFEFADRAMFDPYFNLTRKLQGLPSPVYGSAELKAFDRIEDLAKLASLLKLSPWQALPSLREPVESYRLRIRRIVKTYQNGLGTLNALRSMVEAALPLFNEGLPDRSFSIEEFVPVAPRSAKKAQGIFKDRVGPLMRWTISHNGLAPASPTLYIQGVKPQSGEIDATKDPLIEIYQAGSVIQRIGIGYKGTVAPDKTLRLRPAFASFTARDTGICRAESLPDDDGTTANPAAPGPWLPVSGSPSEKVVDICRTLDNHLWVLFHSGSLRRYDGQTWTQVLEGLPEPRCIAPQGHDLLIGTATGMQIMPLFPEEGEPFTTTSLATLAQTAVNAIFETDDGGWWLGTGKGVFKLLLTAGPSGTTIYEAEAFALREDNGTGAEIFAVHEDSTGNLFFGGVLGLFLYQAGTGHWYWYEGKDSSDNAPDWQRFYPSEQESEKRNFPTSDRVYLPPVHAIHRGPDASIWLGTSNGIARYVAHSVRGLTYNTVLEAFPDLMEGNVYQIVEDARAHLWFCTDRGLFSFDGRDWWQSRETGLKPIGRADTLYTTFKEERGAYRFLRDTSRWERFENEGLTFTPISSDESPVYAILFADHVIADMGTWDGSSFTQSSPVDNAELIMRYKPTETRIVNGGLPSIPRQPVGASVWRYLSLEPDELTAPTDLPAWTVEGRLWEAPERPIAYPGRFNRSEPPPHPESRFDEVVFAFNPAARVWFESRQRQLMTVLVRLNKRSENETIDPVVLDRVWQGIQQVRPAGIQAILAVEDKIVHTGENNG